MTERVAADGTIVEPLAIDEVGGIVRALAGRGHRGRGRLPVAQLSQSRSRARSSPPPCTRCAPELAVSLSSDVMPDMREYERASTAVANAYVQPVVRSLSRPAGGRIARGRHRRRPDADRIGCRHHRARGGAALSGAPGRIGSRGRRARRIVPGPARRRARRDRLRRGRHHRQSLRHRRRRARARRRVRSRRACTASPKAAACR